MSARGLARKTKSRAFRATAVAVVLAGALEAACGWDPTHPFERNSPVVGEAIEQLDAGDAGSATQILQDYLSTGSCTQGSIGTPLLVRARPNGGVDLGLSLFRVAEGYGQRFGDEDKDGGLDEFKKGVRGGDIECARKIVQAIAEDDSVSIDLRARARFIEGNLQFLDAKYKDAVKAYDLALALAPGMTDGGDPIGRDAAWNRAIALRRIEDQKDAGKDASDDKDGSSPPGDGGNQGNDGGKGGDGGGNGNDSGGGGRDSGGDDNQRDSGGSNDRPDSGPQRAEEPPATMDDRILDKLENAPTVQQEAAKKQGQKRRVRVLQDK
jgi:hypothetical protein